MKTFKIIIFIVIFFVLISAAIAGFIFYGLFEFYMPVAAGEGEAKMIEAQKGQGVKEIAAELEEQKLIRSAFWFETYVWLSGKQNKLQAGKYSISSSMNMAQIIDLISGGKVAENDIWVTIPEGFTLKQIKTRLSESGLSVAQDIDNKNAVDLKSQYQFLADAPSGANLEGFLFPDTYKFDKDSSQNEIILKMLDNFDRKLTDKMRVDIASQEKSVFEIIIMASILEKEVRGEDRKIASGIFWKRISDNYSLESDATLSYIFDDKIDRHTIEQTKVDSPYNTYKYKGLPAGPINNPGIEAIEAAIYPQESDYYFFLTKSDTGEAVFSKTLQEHNQNKVKYLK
ncbi:MAG: endolytic transglycosylase MltG [Candidatus Portnoybacteria bacterium]|nr:endolytic transglycosylase MltG [Candidatus Portnoybacteria bacterium]